MTDAKFEKMTRSEKRLYGPPTLALCGFPAAAQPKFETVLNHCGISAVTKLWLGQDHLDTPLSELLTLPDQSGVGIDSHLPRAIIVAGISEAELHRLMSVCRQSGMRQALWAALTPTSETWTLAALLSELEAERAALATQKNR